MVLLATVRALLRLRKAENISRLSARQWQSTFDALSEGIALLDNEDRLLRCNRAMAEFLALPYSEIGGAQGKALVGRFLGARDGFDDVEHRISREYQVDERWFRVTIDPITTDIGERAGRILVLADITDRLLKEEALRASEKLAATGRLAHAIAHEINNPLEALTNLIYLAANVVQEQPASDYLTMAQSEINRISRITKQTLAFNRDTDHPVEFDAADAIRGVLTLYGRDLLEKRITANVRSEPAPLLGYPGELKQIVSNLLRNCIDALGSRGSIRIRIRRCSAAEDQKSGVQVRITDNGPGIDPEVRPRIFDAFFTTKELKGSGLGLWLTASLVSKRGGHISFRTRTSPAIHGTSFAVFVPDQPE
jgi:signal transduction histidine kinase